MVWTRRATGRHPRSGLCDPAEDFASVAIKRSDVEPTSEEVEEQISDLLSQYSSTEHITDRAAADGDTVDINYVGSVNNVEFTGGSAENYDLTLGSGTFIDGFEDQIIGHKPGETFDVNVTFPDATAIPPTPAAIL